MFATAGTGVFLLAMGFLSSLLALPNFYNDAFAGYDPPFDAIAGALLVAISFRIADRSVVAWLFSLLAPALTLFAAIVSPNPFSLSSAVAACALAALIFPYSVGFFRGSSSGPESTQLLVVVAALLSLLFGMTGARWLGGQFKPAIHGWTEALYFTVTTISTNGSDYIPQSDTASAFVVVLILLGVGTFLSAVVVLFLPFLERRLERIAQRLERAQMEDLSDHVVICGASAAARATAASLREDGVRSIILSPNSEAVDLLRGEGEAAHLGEPSNEDDLRAVGIERARALVAADDSDAENLLTVITARGIQSGLRIVAVATSPSSLAKLRRAGANEAISAVAVAAKLVSAAVLHPTGTGGPPARTSAH
ncbi:MAG TPA: NAD-binding protein [Thermoplasmata archaeon]|nr:NAD-binding protein [Thermoplasmata archaeon]